MTATVASDCTAIEIASDYFLSDNISDTLVVTVNGTENTVDIPTTTLVSYTLTADDLDLESLPNGVYALHLTNVLTDSTTEEESLCRVLLCGEDCEVLDLYTDSANIVKILAFEALKVVNDCISCSCDVATTLYNNYTDSTDDSSCGCN
jgi:hypothetical protein